VHYGYGLSTFRRRRVRQFFYDAATLMDALTDLSSLSYPSDATTTLDTVYAKKKYGITVKQP